MYASPDYIDKTGNHEDLTVTWMEKIQNHLPQDNKSYKAEDYQGKPLLYCAFAHAMENSLGNLREHVDGWYKYSNWCGGFIGDYVGLSLCLEEKDHSDYFNANGIVASDRRWNPSAYEVQKVYQYARVYPSDLENGVVEIENRFLFTNLNCFDWTFEILEDGGMIQEGRIEDIDVHGLSKQRVRIPFQTFEKGEGILYHLNIFCRLKEDNTYGTKGDIIAKEQLAFDVIGEKTPEILSDEPMVVKGKQFKVEVIGKHFNIVISKKSGDIISYRHDENELLRKPIRLNLWRAETDNDRGLTNMNSRAKKAAIDTRYKEASESYTLKNYEIEEGPDQVLITLYRQVKEMKGPLITIYTVYGDGSMDIELAATPKKELVRFGITMGIDKELTDIAYFGKGPQENYIDRSYGAHMGIYETKLKDFYHMYMRPQENGNHGGIRWLSAEDKKHEGIMIEDSGTKGLGVSMWPYTQEELEVKDHIHELEESGFVTLNIDGFQKGVGGDYPGNLALMDKYKLLPGRQYRFKCHLSRT